MFRAFIFFTCRWLRATRRNFWRRTCCLLLFESGCFRLFNFKLVFYYNNVFCKNFLILNNHHTFLVYFRWTLKMTVSRFRFSTHWTSVLNKRWFRTLWNRFLTFLSFFFLLLYYILGFYSGTELRFYKLLFFNGWFTLTFRILTTPCFFWLLTTFGVKFANLDALPRIRLAKRVSHVRAYRFLLLFLSASI